MAVELSADRLLAALTAGGVEFIVIGGFSVIAHGYVRATKDLGIVPDPAPDNLAPSPPASASTTCLRAQS